MTEKQRVSWSLIGYVQIESVVPAFALPIFVSNQSSDRRFVQLKKESDAGCDFKEIELTDVTIVFVRPTIIVHEASPQTYVFLSGSGSYEVGSIDVLKSRLKATLKRADLSPGTALQIASLLDDKKAIREQRARYCNQLRTHEGGGNWKSYLNSAIRVFAWDLIEKSTSDVEAKAIFRTHRADFDFHIGADFQIGFVCHDPSVSLARFEIGFVLKQLEREFRDLARVDQSAEFNAKQAAVDINAVARTALRDISRMPRQESRMASLIRLSIEKPEAAKIVLRLYGDRAKLATSASKAINSVLFEGVTSKEYLEIEFAKLVQDIYSACYPMNRGILLMDFASELSKFGPINDLIKSIVDRSNSMFVRHYADAILDVCEFGLEEAQALRRSPDLFSS